MQEAFFATATMSPGFCTDARATGKRPLEMTSDARSILCNGNNVTCACRCMRVTVMIALAHASLGRLLHDEDTRQDKFTENRYKKQTASAGQSIY
jgi:hypothetical protein